MCFYVEYKYIYIYIYTQLLHMKWWWTGLNLEFYFSLTGCYTKVKDPSMPYYLALAWGRIIGFIPFSRVLALSEM